MTTSYVLTVRHPDYGNEYTVDGDVHVVDIDLGNGFFVRPGDYETAMDFALSVDRLSDVPITSPVFSAGLAIFREALRDWDNVLPIIDEYEQERCRVA